MGGRGRYECLFYVCMLQVSRAHILNKATEYIRQMQRGSAQRLGEIDDLRKKNELLEEQSMRVYNYIPFHSTCTSVMFIQVLYASRS